MCASGAPGEGVLVLSGGPPLDGDADQGAVAGHLWLLLGEVRSGEEVFQSQVASRKYVRTAHGSSSAED